MKLLPIAALAVVLAGTAAWAAPRRAPPQPQPTRPLPDEKTFPKDATFRLVDIDGKPIPRGFEATLLIDQALRGQGTAGCNTWSATLWPVPGQRLVGGGLNMTRRTCPAPIMALERSYLSVLFSGATWDIQADDLIVKSPRGTLRLRRGF